MYGILHVEKIKNNKWIKYLVYRYKCHKEQCKSIFNYGKKKCKILFKKTREWYKAGGNELEIGEIATLPVFYGSKDAVSYHYIIACKLYDGETEHSREKCRKCVFAGGPGVAYCNNFREPKEIIGNCGTHRNMSIQGGYGVRTDGCEVVFRKIGDKHSEKALGFAPTKDVHHAEITLGAAKEIYAKPYQFCKDFALRFFSKEELEEKSSVFKISYSFMDINEAKKFYYSRSKLRKKFALLFFYESELL